MAKDRRQNRINRLTERLKGIILDDRQGSLAIWKDQHPITWRLVLNRLREDHDEVVRETVKPLLGPGDE